MQITSRGCHPSILKASLPVVISMSKSFGYAAECASDVACLLCSAGALPSVKAYLDAKGLDLKNPACFATPIANPVHMPTPPIATSTPVATSLPSASRIPPLSAHATPRMPAVSAATLTTPGLPQGTVPASLPPMQQHNLVNSFPVPLPCGGLSAARAPAPPLFQTPASQLRPAAFPIPPTPPTGNAFPTPARQPASHSLEPAHATPRQAPPAAQPAMPGPSTSSSTPAPPGPAEQNAEDDVRGLPAKTQWRLSDSPHMRHKVIMGLHAPSRLAAAW